MTINIIQACVCLCPNLVIYHINTIQAKYVREIHDRNRSNYRMAQNFDGGKF